MSTIAAIRRGFTLVELLIVIVVIAILAGLSVAAFSGIRERAMDAAIEAVATDIIKAAQRREVLHGTVGYGSTPFPNRQATLEGYGIESLASKVLIYMGPIYNDTFDEVFSGGEDFDKSKVQLMVFPDGIWIWRYHYIGDKWILTAMDGNGYSTMDDMGEPHIPG